MNRLINKLISANKTSRTSTKYSMRAGWFLFVSVVALTAFGLHLGIISATNIVAVVWAYLITAAGMFGINMTRVTVENVKDKELQKTKETPKVTEATQNEEKSS